MIYTLLFHLPHTTRSGSVRCDALSFRRWITSRALDRVHLWVYYVETLSSAIATHSQHVRS
jgi:hypothetical protein